jgi:hypothetical protein
MALTGEEGLAKRAAMREEIRRWRAGETGPSEEQRRAWREDEKAKIGAMLARAESYGRGAFRTAVQLLDSGMSYGDILAAARKTPAGPPSDQVHRVGIIRGDSAFMAREETPQAEEGWLKEAREQAEREWAAAHPQRKAETAKFQNLRPSEIAFGRMALGLAQAAAGLDYDEGQKRHRGDHLDAELQRRGAEAAKRLWPGR